MTKEPLREALERIIELADYRSGWRVKEEIATIAKAALAAQPDVVVCDMPRKGAFFVTTDRARELALEKFTEYFVRNYPGPDTVIHKPEWHAPKIFRAAEDALASLLESVKREARLEEAKWWDKHSFHNSARIAELERLAKEGHGTASESGERVKGHIAAPQQTQASPKDNWHSDGIDADAE